MFFTNNRTLALILLLAVFVLLSSLSCTAIVKDNKQPLNSQLFAENSTMKKRLPLIERENDVLKKENQQHRTKIHDLEMQNKQLAAVLTSLNEKYTNDMATGEEQILDLESTISEMEQETAERIELLTAQKNILEEKLVRETKVLNEKLVKQKTAFNQEREQILQQNAKKELDWSTEIGVLKKQLEPMEMQISSLKLAINEISIQLGAATALSEELRKTRDASLAEVDSLKQANSNLNKKIVELSIESPSPDSLLQSSK